MQEDMKLFTTSLVATMAASIVMSSEVDLALIRSVRIEADTSVHIFGKVTVNIEVTGSMGNLSELGLHALVAEWNGDTHSIPQEALLEIDSIDMATFEISSEYGYPDQGLGPSLYMAFTGKKNGVSYIYHIEFGKDGYKQLNKEASNMSLQEDAAKPPRP